jgi:glycosyltransferase involved in cell wall biosynthesis
MVIQTRGNERLRVLQLISSGGYYGAENMLLNLIGSDEFAGSQNLLAIIYNRHHPNTELYDRAIQRGIKAELVPYQGRIDRQGFREIGRLAREHHIVHTHGYKADLYGYLAARREGKPVVATCHNWLGGGAMLAAYNFLDRRALKHFDGVSAVSQTIAERLLSLGVRRERLTVIPNGIDVRAFDASSSTDRSRTQQVIGIVARLDLQKGFEYLLNAVATLRASFPGVRLLVAGEGPDRARIEELVRRQNLSSVVTLAGRQTDMPGFYAAIDIFVLPSLNEGLPMTLLEAMAASKAIVATRVGAIPSVITDGETGLLVEPADEAGLTNALTQLLANSELRRRLAQKARARVEQDYTAAAMGRKYLAMYREVLTRRGSSEASQIQALLAPDAPNRQRAGAAGSGTSEPLAKTPAP